MAIVVGLLRGINLGKRRMKMEALRSLCESLELTRPQTYIQSGNIVFETKEKKLDKLATRMADAIEAEFGFRSEVVLRTAAEMRDVLRRNPFAERKDINPGKLLAWFLESAPAANAHAMISAFPSAPEEVVIDGREVFIYFPNGQARPILSMAAVEKALGVPGTGRNWNTVLKLNEMAQALE